MVQPFGYYIDSQNFIDVTTASKVINKGNIRCNPYYKLKGNGFMGITVNGTKVSIPYDTFTILDKQDAQQAPNISVGQRFTLPLGYKVRVIGYAGTFDGFKWYKVRYIGLPPYPYEYTDYMKEESISVSNEIEIDTDLGVIINRRANAKATLIGDINALKFEKGENTISFTDVTKAEIQMNCRDR